MSDNPIRNELVTVIQTLLEKRKDLANLTLKRVRTDIKRNQIERKAIQREAEVAFGVCNEVNKDTGKPRWTNESARRAEVTFRLAHDEQVIKTYKTKKGKERKVTTGFIALTKDIEAKKRRSALLRSREDLLMAEAKNLAAFEHLLFLDLDHKGE